MGIFCSRGKWEETDVIVIVGVRVSWQVVVHFSFCWHRRTAEAATNGGHVCRARNVPQSFHKTNSIASITPICWLQYIAICSNIAIYSKHHSHLLDDLLLSSKHLFSWNCHLICVWARQMISVWEVYKFWWHLGGSQGMSQKSRLFGPKNFTFLLVLNSQTQTVTVYFKTLYWKVKSVGGTRGNWRCATERNRRKLTTPAFFTNLYPPHSCTHFVGLKCNRGNLKL